CSQCDILRDLFGSHFHLTLVLSSWLAWNGGTVRQLARSIDEERAFDRLPILADALEEAGCADEAILSHLRKSRRGRFESSRGPSVNANAGGGRTVAIMPPGQYTQFRPRSRGPEGATTAVRSRCSLMADDVTGLLSAVERGDPHAAEELLPLVYDELRRLAAR